MAHISTGTARADVRDQHGNEFFYNEPEFVVASSTFGRKLAPEHEEVLQRARARVVERWRERLRSRDQRGDATAS
jgi:hypothetical protein